MALGAALAVAGLLQLSPCTAGLIVEADVMVAIVLRIAHRFCTACSKEFSAILFHPSLKNTPSNEAFACMQMQPNLASWAPAFVENWL